VIALTSSSFTSGIETYCETPEGENRIRFGEWLTKSAHMCPSRSSVRFSTAPIGVPWDFSLGCTSPESSGKARCPLQATIDSDDPRTSR
jgi:hypothetical protein